MYSASDLSRYIINQCMVNGNPISNLQLQKILYYIQRDSLQKYNVPAFEDRIEAWRFGPVVPSIYYEYCEFGAMPITMNYPDSSNVIDIHDREWMHRIILEKALQNPWELVEDTHKPGGAWDQVYGNGQEKHVVIPLDLIRTAG